MTNMQFLGYAFPTNKYLLDEKSKKAIQEAHKVSRIVRKNARNTKRAAKVLFFLIAPAMSRSRTVIYEDSIQLRRDFDKWVATGDEKDFFVDPVGDHFLFGIVDGHNVGLEKFLNEREVFNKSWEEWEKKFRKNTILPLTEKLSQLGVRVTVSTVKGRFRQHLESNYYSYDTIKKFLDKDGCVDVEHPELRIRFKFID